MTLIVRLALSGATDAITCLLLQADRSVHSDDSGS